MEETINQKIKKQAGLLGFSISDWDVEQIKENHFQVLVAYADQPKVIRRLVKEYCEDRGYSVQNTENIAYW